MSDPYTIGGLPCSAFGSSEALQGTLARLVSSGRGGYTVAINAEKIVRARRDSVLRLAVSNATLAVPDGFMAVLALRWIHCIRSIKTDLPECALRQANDSGWTVAICGGLPEVNDEASSEILLRYPKLNLVANIDGYQPTESIRELLARTRPQLALLAMGSPKQELLAYEWQSTLRGTLVVGCGGALDIFAGRAKRAPAVLVNNGLEWAYRLLRDPRRIRRQMALPVALAIVLREGAVKRFMAFFS